MQQKPAIIIASNLEKFFGKTHALRGLSLTVKQGEILAIMGPSGSGKSTLLHCLAAIIAPDKGKIEYLGKDISKLNNNKRAILRRTDFGFVFQFSQLVPELTALDNVALPLLLNDVSKKEAYEKAKEWLGIVGLKNQINKIPGQLSGGQAQRVAIARAMIIEPKILFADEPTGSLDSLNSEKIMELFTKVTKEHDTTVIMVTHEPTIAAYADREVIVRDGMIASEEGK